MEHFHVDIHQRPEPKSIAPRFTSVKIRWKGRAITDLTQGIHRCYLFPVYSPAGVSLTSESPVDHPHHNSITVSADVFFVQLPPLSPAISTLTEEATYNFYVNNIFQGRAPGRIWVVGVDSEEISENHLRVVQTIQWQGPEEWGAPADIGRRVLAEETRTIDIHPGEIANVIDIRSQLRPTDWDVTIGTTRHAYFTIRMADELRPTNGGKLIDSEGRVGQQEVCNQLADWVDISGPAVGGQKAGITVIPHASAAGIEWFCFDYGTMLLNPFMREKGILNRGDELDLGIRILAHDGDTTEAGVADLYEAFKYEKK